MVTLLDVAHRYKIMLPCIFSVNTDLKAMCKLKEWIY